MSTLSQFMSGGGGGGEGPYNRCLMFNSPGSWTWSIPTDFDESLPINVYVWGAGGSMGQTSGTGEAHGGGGGGLAIKKVSGLSAGGSVSVQVGAPTYSYNGQAGTSSFGSHVSATGGCSGYCNTESSGQNSTGESSNPQSGQYGQGGVGVGGDINRRGGRGGHGSISSSSGYAGGGGSAPHPDGHMDGKYGGGSTSYNGGGGASINYDGVWANYTNYCSAGGSGTAGRGTTTYAASTYYGPAGVGGAGIDGAGGSGGNSYSYSNAGVTTGPAQTAGGSGLWLPNRIFLGGGGGAGGSTTYQSSERVGANAGCGGPGAGGGGSYNYGASCHYMSSGGNGGILGGGGGVGLYNVPGNGGSAGGAGGCGYGWPLHSQYEGGVGGGGIVFIQYKIIF